MKPFEYHEPETIRQACQLLKEYGDQARIMAGGTDLVIKMKRGLVSPKHVIDIKKIPDIRGVEKTREGVWIGAATSLADVADAPGLQEGLSMISRAALSIGSTQVRNRATIGGNICNAAPSADMAPGLLVAEAVASVSGPESAREVPLASFFTGPGTTRLAEGEIVTRLYIPLPPETRHMVYIKHGPRRSMDCAVVGVAVALDVDSTSSICRDVRIALGAVAPTPVRAARTEKLIEGKTFTGLDYEAIGARVREEISPITDVRASAEYRSDMVSILTIQALERIEHESGESKH